MTENRFFRNTHSNFYMNAIPDAGEHLGATGAENNPYGLRGLWRAVIAQALIDALNGSKKVASKIERARSIAWFSLSNKEFLIVCAYADLDPHYVIQKVRQALLAGKK